jgi:hypothetical protein
VLYAFLCVVVPTGWGLAMLVVSNHIERAARRSLSGRRMPPVHYGI